MRSTPFIYSLIVSLVISIATLSGCKQLKQLTHKEEKSVICLKNQTSNKHSFYATGSAKTLEAAKLNARQDLVQQISSNVSSSIEQKLTQNRDSHSQQSSSWAKSESENIPLDQHRVEQTCKSGKTFYAAISLSKQALLHSSQQRIKQVIESVEPELNQLKQESRYRQYVKRRQLEKSLNQLQTYNKLLDSYQPDLLTPKTKAFTRQLVAFINQAAKLLIGIADSNRHLPTTAVIEQALNKAQLEYQQGTRDAVAIIAVNANDSSQRVGNRHIVKLQASLDVNRADTGKLLKRHELGKIVTTSTVSAQLALDNAYQQLSNRVKQHLSVSPASIRKILGFEE